MRLNQPPAASAESVLATAEPQQHAEPAESTYRVVPSTASEPPEPIWSLAKYSIKALTTAITFGVGLGLGSEGRLKAPSTKPP